MSLTEYRQLQSSLAEIASKIGGVVIGDPSTPITGVASIDEATEGDLVFAESARFLEAALRSRAAAVLLAESMPLPQTGMALVQVADPRRAFVQALELLAPPEEVVPGIDATAQIGERVRLGSAVRIEAYVTIGADVEIGDGVVLMSGVRIGAGCAVGAGTVLHPNVVLYPHVTLGQRCILHSGCVLGSDGFGYVQVGASLRKVPHLGGVQVGNDVEIGANSCIDRAKTGATVIGDGVKIDNLVHIAHNVRIGPSCILVSQVGIAGSVTLGAGVILAGQVGLIPHLKIGDGARIAAQSGLMNDVPAGETWFGSPAVPHAQRLREIAASRKMSDALKQLRSLEKRVMELEAQRKEETS